MRKEGLREKKLIAANQNFKEQEFWRERLSGHIPKSHFPYCPNHGILPRPGWGKVPFKLEGGYFNRLMEQCRQSDYKLHILLTTVLALLMRFYSYPQARRLLLATPIYKPGEEEDFINTLLPLLIEVDNHLTVKEILSQVGKAMVEASNHQNFPMEILFERMDLPVSPTGLPLLDVALLLTNLQDPLHLHEVYFSTLFSFTRRAGGLEGELRCRTDLYDHALAENMARHFIHLLEQIVIDLEVKVSQLQVLPATERIQLLRDFNRLLTAGSNHTTVEEDSCLQRLFETQARSTPEKIALVDRDRQLTYGELNRRANRLAGLLVTRGVQPSTLVAAAAEPCCESIIGMMAIFKAGGIYLPVSPIGPTESNAKIVLENKVDLLLARRHLQETPNNLFQAFSPGNIIFLDDEENYPPEQSSLNLAARSNEPACILYTSGTTGLPRGVLMAHRDIIHLVSGLNSAIYKKHTGHSTLHLALVTLFMSGLSLKQIFGALLTGQTLHFFPQRSQVTGHDLYEFYRRYRIDISDGAPAHIRWLSEELTGDREKSLFFPVKHILVGGEILPVKMLKAFFQCFQNDAPLVTNIYGTAEGGDVSTLYTLGKDNIDEYGHVPVGKPFPGVQLYVLGKEYQVQAVGVPGELWMGGAGLTIGYFNQPERTAEKFRRAVIRHSSLVISSSKLSTNDQCPMTNDRSPQYPNTPLPHYPIYRTGDLARWLPDGNLEFLGRNDGMSIIEYHLTTHPDITGCSVSASQDEEETGRLLAYITTEREIDTEELKKYLAQRLPASQIPGKFKSVNRLPLTANFKIDRKQWLERRIETRKVFIAPRDQMERQLLRLWSEVLEIEETQISIDANFLELNGNSLKTIMLISRIFKEFEVQVPLAEVFKAPTIIGLSQYIKHAAKGKFIPRQPAERKEYYPLSSAQKRLYFIHQLDSNSTVYNIFQYGFLDNSLGKSELNHIFRQLIHRHQILRTSFPLVDNKPVQRVHPGIDFEVEFSAFAPGEITPGNTAQLDQVIEHFVKPFNLAHPPLFRVKNLALAENQYILLIDMHHIVTDLISMQILIRDFSMLCHQQPLKPLILQYRDYSEWQNKKEIQENIEKQRKFWLKEFAAEIPPPGLPYDFPKPSIPDFSGDKFSFKIDKENASKLKALALKEDLTLFILFLAIYNIFLAKITGQADIVVGTGTVGRAHADLEDIVGMFISLIALRNYPTSEKTFSEFLREVKARTLEAFENQEYPYEELLREIAAAANRNLNQLFDVGFTFLFHNIEQNESEKVNFKIMNYESKTSKLDLTLTAQEVGGEIHFTYEYCTKLFKKSKIHRFADYFREIAAAVAGNNDIPLQDIRISHGYSQLTTNILDKIQGDFGF